MFPSRDGHVVASFLGCKDEPSQAGGALGEPSEVPKGECRLGAPTSPPAPASPATHLGRTAPLHAAAPRPQLWHLWLRPAGPGQVHRPPGGPQVHRARREGAPPPATPAARRPRAPSRRRLATPPPQVTKYVEREILNHRQLVHPHIIQFKEVFLTPQYLVISMEFAAGGDMFEYVVRKGGLRESEARWFFQQLIVAVDYIHRMVSRAEQPRGGQPAPGGADPGASPRPPGPGLTPPPSPPPPPRRASPTATSSWRTPCWTAPRGRSSKSATLGAPHPPARAAATLPLPPRAAPSPPPSPPSLPPFHSALQLLQAREVPERPRVAGGHPRLPGP